MSTTLEHPQDVKPPSLWLPTAALFASLTTLICCALPAALVALGMGAVMAGLITAVPGIVWFGTHKALVFGVAGALLAASGFWLWRARSMPCPADPAQARACMRLRAVSWWIWGGSVLLFAIGGFFAFFAAALLA
jgi:hypothetical protein